MTIPLKSEIFIITSEQSLFGSEFLPEFDVSPLFFLDFLFGLLSVLQFSLFEQVEVFPLSEVGL